MITQELSDSFLICCCVFLAMHDLVFVELMMLCLSPPHQTIKSCFRNIPAVFLAESLCLTELRHFSLVVGTIQRKLSFPC